MGLSIDREKVIKALECRKNADKRCGNPCEESGMCYYATAIRGLDGDIYKPFICDRERICADALVLLKEQEAVPVIQREIAHMFFWCCGSCGVAITDGDKFCRMCGRAVKWE